MGKFIALFVLLFSSISFARIGETETELEARFGKPFAREGNQLLYKKDKYAFSFMMIDGVAESFLVKKDDSGKITRTEAQVFMEKNSGGRPWDEKGMSLAGIIWEVKDENGRALLTSVLFNENGTLLIYSHKASARYPELFLSKDKYLQEKNHDRF